MDKPNSPDAARPAPYAAGTGTAPLPPDPQALARMSYRERLAPPRPMRGCAATDEPGPCPELTQQRGEDYGRHDHQARKPH